MSTIIGPLTKERVVNKFVAKVLAGENILVQGGEQIFSFLDVRDAATGILTILTSDKTDMRPTYNIGTKSFATLKEIAELVVEVGCEKGYERTEISVEPADIVMNNKIVVNAVRNDFGWEAKYTLKESVENIFDTQISQGA